MRTNDYLTVNNKLYIKIKLIEILRLLVIGIFPNQKQFFFCSQLSKQTQT